MLGIKSTQKHQLAVWYLQRNYTMEMPLFLLLGVSKLQKHNEKLWDSNN